MVKSYIQLDIILEVVNEISSTGLLLIEWMTFVSTNDDSFSFRQVLYVLWDGFLRNCNETMISGVVVVLVDIS